ncbi:MAG: hypothetical protein ACRDPK_03935 [Carbonactinosporaceae bacterium]
MSQYVRVDLGALNGVQAELVRAGEEFAGDGSLTAGSPDAGPVTGAVLAALARFSAEAEALVTALALDAARIQTAAGGYTATDGGNATSFTGISEALG